jgi:hypothetical protein
MAAGIKATLGLDVVVRTGFKGYNKTMYSCTVSTYLPHLLAAMLTRSPTDIYSRWS